MHRTVWIALEVEWMRVAEGSEHRQTSLTFQQDRQTLQCSKVRGYLESSEVQYSTPSCLTIFFYRNMLSNPPPSLYGLDACRLNMTGQFAYGERESRLEAMRKA